jgi:anti-sigma regulatory factor (Ser/Thr protein kinase)
MCRVVTKKFAGRDPMLVAMARHWLADYLGLWEVTVPAQTAELLVSELVTNAIRHGGGSPTVKISIRSASLEVGVTDDDLSHLPDPANHRGVLGLPLDPTAVGGRGLAIVDGLASEWGTAATDNGKHVWFRLATDDWPHLSDCDCASNEGEKMPSGRTVHAMPGSWDR